MAAPESERADVAAIARRWRTDYDRGAHDYTDAGCRVLAEHAFRDVDALLSALAVSEQASEQARAIVEREKACDCVEFPLSSSACQKCGRPFTITHERWVEWAARVSRTEVAEQTLSEEHEANKKLARIGTKLADAAERLEENPLANCLPRFRYPVVDAVLEWRDALAAVGGAHQPGDDPQIRDPVYQRTLGWEDSPASSGAYQPGEEQT